MTFTVPKHNECRCHPVNHSNKCFPVKVIINPALTILFDGMISDFTEFTKSQSVWVPCAWAEEEGFAYNPESQGVRWCDHTLLRLMWVWQQHCGWPLGASAPNRTTKWQTGCHRQPRAGTWSKSGIHQCCHTLKVKDELYFFFKCPYTHTFLSISSFRTIKSGHERRRVVMFLAFSHMSSPSLLLWTGC